MRRRSMRTESTAAIARHPIHPLLVAFPIASFVGALVADSVFLYQDEDFWARAAEWLVGAGLATGALAALFGLTDFLTIPRARRWEGWVHFLGNATVLGLASVNLVIRLDDHLANVNPWGVVLSSATVGILLITGWTGGELAYRHHVGMIEEVPEEREMERRRAA